MSPTADALLLRTQSDERLAALARSGSERAFVTLVERHRRLLYATALRLVPAADADDLVQQALLSAWTALRGGADVRHVRAWLVQILRNAATRQLARRVEADDLEAVAVAAPDDAHASFQTRVTLRETLANVARLPEQQRVALLRTVAGGASQQEIAVQLGTSEGGVRQLVHRARQSLRAAATAVTPWPLLVRVADASPEGAVAAGAGAAGATGAGLAAKVALGLVAAGALGAAGVATQHSASDRLPGAAVPREAASAPAAGAAASAQTPTASSRPPVARGRRDGHRAATDHPRHGRSRTGAAPHRVGARTRTTAPTRQPQRRTTAPTQQPQRHTAPTAPRPVRHQDDTSDDHSTTETTPEVEHGDDASGSGGTETTTTASDDGATSAGSDSDGGTTTSTGGGGTTTTDGGEGSDDHATTTTTTTTGDR